MNTKDLLASIDQEITRLQRVRNLLSSGGGDGVGIKRPKKHKKHEMSAEGRQRIAEAQRRRWAERKKQK